MLCATRPSAALAAKRASAAATPLAPRPRLAAPCRRLAAAEDNGAASTTTTEQPAAAAAAPATPPPATAPAPSAPVLIKGQGTAIVTGAVSILFGIAYLALAQLMSSRGGEMLPPPPEAFLP
jgi:hypothetical protein